MSKIKEIFWGIFEKIVQNLESFTFILFLNLLFIIVPDDSSSRLTIFLLKKKECMGGCKNNLQIKVFFDQLGNFSYRIHSTYVPEGMCIIGHTGNLSQDAEWAILSTMMDI